MSKAAEMIVPRVGPGGARQNSGGARVGAGRPRKLPVHAPQHLDVERWYCVRTERGRERQADIAVRLDGFKVFNPSVFKPATPSHRVAAHLIWPGKPDRIEALFKRYFFVRLNLSEVYWHRIRRLPGVDRIISSSGYSSGRPGIPMPGVPIAVPDSAIDWVRGLDGFAPNGCVYPPNHRDTPIEAGTSLRLPGGPLVDRGSICTWNDRQGVITLMQLLGRPIV
jgi:transcription antitermination factor NusG